MLARKTDHPVKDTELRIGKANFMIPNETPETRTAGEHHLEYKRTEKKTKKEWLPASIKPAALALLSCTCRAYKSTPTAPIKREAE